MRRSFLALLVLGGLCAGQAAPGGLVTGELAPPVAVAVGGRAIDVPPSTVSSLRDDNSFPWAGDFDGDGKLDLLIGQAIHGDSREGHLRTYRNLGGPDGPRLAEPVWFHDRVPTGRIPRG